MNESVNKSVINPEQFWWVNLGEQLIRAIVEVADEKNKLKREKLKKP